MSYNPLPVFCTIQPSWIEGLGVFAIKEIRNEELTLKYTIYNPEL